MRGQQPLTDKSGYLGISSSFLSALAGLIDGDGYIAVTRTGKGYIEILLSISLDVRDQLLLQEIRDTLGFGRLAGPFFNRDGSTTVKIIFSRTELQELLFPLFIHHGIFFLTDTRRAQYQLALHVVTSQITKFDLIPSVIPTIYLPALPTTALEYLALSFLAD